MKRKLSFCILIIFVNLSVGAQDTAKSTRRRAGAEIVSAKHPEQIRKSLDLTTDQKNALFANRLETRSKGQAIKNNKNLTGAEKRYQLSALYKEQDEKKNALLSPAQKDILKEAKNAQNLADQNEAEKGRIEMKDKLSLTDYQYAKLQELDLATQLKLKAINNNLSLNAETKKKQITSSKQLAASQRKLLLTREQERKWEMLKRAANEKIQKKIF